MTQVKSVTVATGSTTQPAASPDPATPVKKALTLPERRPDLYIRTQKVDVMSNKQIRGELSRMIRHNRLPHEIQINEKTGAVKGVSKGAQFDAAFAVVLKIMLDNHVLGMSSFPR
jgi:1-deoxy-D-xylulose 5-phosphate reductoisomerase